MQMPNNETEVERIERIAQEIFHELQVRPCVRVFGFGDQHLQPNEFHRLGLVLLPRLIQLGFRTLAVEAVARHNPVLIQYLNDEIPLGRYHWRIRAPFQIRRSFPREELFREEYFAPMRAFNAVRNTRIASVVADWGAQGRELFMFERLRELLESDKKIIVWSGWGHLINRVNRNGNFASAIEQISDWLDTNGRQQIYTVAQIDDRLIDGYWNGGIQLINSTTRSAFFRRGNLEPRLNPILQVGAPFDEIRDLPLDEIAFTINDFDAFYVCRD